MQAPRPVNPVGRDLAVFDCLDPLSREQPVFIHAVRRGRARDQHVPGTVLQQRFRGRFDLGFRRQTRQPQHLVTVRGHDIHEG